MVEVAMARSKRDLHVESIDALVRNRIASVAKTRDWELLEEIARIVECDAPVDLAATDPAMFIALRNAITNFHLNGWSHMTPDRVRAIARDHEVPDSLKVA